ncbi:MAG: 2-C-methyl-D-erythritol 2,4-cyclodiphosphate synthase [Desulfobacteraceae bacterium]|nr:2-C-methyl-D-erythritol 2,4-cyclodiphosphate synthase [Desulfobacteraceae bacterium]
MDIRTGIGFDVHKFEKERKLILGGVEIPYEFGLKGHSDADVLLHALTDAVLGAAGLGDIGEHFPDNDDKYKNIQSFILLKKSYDLVKESGFTLSNADIIVIAEKPKLSPYKNQIKSNIAKYLNVDPSRINVSATTTEKLGFTGRKEGIASLCTVLLIKD